jgi:pyridoxal phosphate enzyme (YggS family)
LDLKANIARIKQRIDHALKASDKGQGDVTLIVVTKYVNIDTIKAAIAEGIEIIGENRVQMAKTKYQGIGNSVRWHMIGHLQQNKVSDAVRIFELIHSVDSLYLAEAINEEAFRQNKIQDVLIQINTSGEKAKYGLSLDEVDALFGSVSDFSHLNIKGLMTIGPLPEKTLQTSEVLSLRSCFQQLFQLYQHLKATGFPLQYLSMGMSDDFETAISEGSNMVRIGQAIFGER